TWQGTSPEDAVLFAGLTNRFIYNNDISALYATLGGKVNDFSFSAGVRGEAWQIKTKSLGLGETEADQQWYKKNNFALFPSLFLSYSLQNDNEVQINYTRRIRRPWGGQLNSFRNISDATNISFGNPELEPQYANAFELNYIKSWTWHMISLSAYVRTSNNTMNRISYMDGDILYSTWANVANNTNSGVELVGKNSLFNGKLDLTTTVNLYNNHVSAWDYTYTDPDGKQFHLSGDKQQSFAWDARLMASVKLPWSLSFQATGRYNSRQLEAQGQRDAGWNVDAGLRRVFGDWSVSINCRDVFDSRRWKSTLNGPGYTQYSERWRGGRNVRLTVKYAFGNMKQKPQHRPNGEADDSMDSGSNYSSEGAM
ncbi:MAG: outer membrane beta-barrel family protein, partial [Muribaculaceae bacterium]|nr:outer membrane beta-barrel family protein [Muribaculaceae bacterium]